jgi:hypothetical protein
MKGAIMPRKTKTDVPLGDSYNLIGLVAQNVKKIKVVHLEFNEEENFITIGGKNEQGKSSLIDAIAWLFTGNRGLSEVPVRKGAKKAVIEADIKCLEDEFPELHFKKVIPATGGVPTLTISSKDKKSYPSPQAIADALLGPHRFLDPLGFINLPRKEQLEATKSLVGLDFTDKDAERAKIYDDRTAVNRDLKTTESKLNELEYDKEAPGVPIVISDLMAELERRREVNKEKESKQHELWFMDQEIKKSATAVDTLKDQILTHRKRIEDIENEIASINIFLSEKNDHLKKQKAKRDAFAEKIKDLVTENDLEVVEQIKQAQNINKKVESNIKYLNMQNSIKAMRKKQAEMTFAIEQIDEWKKMKLAEAQFPVDGLSFDEQGVLYNGLPFQKGQVSTEEMLRVSMNMAMAMNPKLKVFLIPNSIYLDKEKQAIIASEAKKNNYQVIMERGGEGEDITLIIEDGMVKESEAPK